MRALTVCQPYAELLARGVKPIENRTWSTAHRGPLVIHAGKSRDWLAPGDEARYPDLVFGAIVAVVTLYDVVPVEGLPPDLRANEHANGPWCWLVRDPIRLHPRPVRGAQGLWAIDRALVVRAYRG